jgi:hypothetical protein
MATIDWKRAWENPEEIVTIITNNQKTALQLEAIGEKIEEEERLAKSIKKSGYVYEEDRKKELLESILNIDPALANAVASLSGRDEIVAVIQQRVIELKRTIQENEATLRDVLRREQETLGIADVVVDRYLAIITEIGELYKKEIENIGRIEVYENELRAVAQQGTLSEKIDYFEQEAVKAGNLAIENQHLQERVIRLLEELNTLKQQAGQVQQRVEQETEQISNIKKLFAKVLSMLGFNKKTESKEATKELKEAEEKETRGLRPAWAH